MNPSKEGEVKDYSQAEKRFLQMTITGIKHRQDGMIEVPLPFKTDHPQFAWNRGGSITTHDEYPNEFKKEKHRNACKQLKEI